MQERYWCADTLAHHKADTIDGVYLQLLYQEFKAESVLFEIKQITSLPTLMADALSNLGKSFSHTASMVLWQPSSNYFELLFLADDLVKAGYVSAIDY